MLLTEISDLIVIDEIINEKKYVHFLTHCENRFFTETGFTSKIYTSKNIARILYRHKKIPLNVFNILQPNHTTKIQLSNGQNVNVTLFEGDLYTNNISFHFENSKTTLFYCGHFRNIYGLFKNKLCFDLNNAGIDYLYIDNTRSNAEYVSSVNEIGIRLKHIMKLHPNYKIIISLPNYGYEDLLVNLLVKHQFKIFIGIHQKDILTHLKFDGYLVNTIKDAQLIIRKDIVDMDCIKERYTKKHGITVRIVEYDKEVVPQNFEHLGLYQIHYSPHITQFEIFSLIAYFQPKYIREIYQEFSNIPKLLREASLVLRAEKDEKIDNISETTTKTDYKTDPIEKKINNAIKFLTPRKREIDMQLNNNCHYINNNSEHINTNKLEIHKHNKIKIRNISEKEFIKPCPKMVAKNIIKELFDEFADCDNVGDNYCNEHLHKNVNDVAIFNSDKSDISKSLLENEYLYGKKRQEQENNYHVTPESINVQEDTRKVISPRIGSKRNYDEKYHIPKEKHRKLLVNSSIKETTAHVPDIKLNNTKQKSNVINSSNQTHQNKNSQNRIHTNIPNKNQSNIRNNRNISGIANRSKTPQKKTPVNTKLPNSSHLSDEQRDTSDKTNKKITLVTPEYPNKCAIADCSKQKIYKRNTSKPIEYINSDED